MEWKVPAFAFASIDLGFSMLKAYPKNETALQTFNLNKNASYTDTFSHLSPKMTHTNPHESA
jgi:hypothetical protein